MKTLKRGINSVFLLEDGHENVVWVFSIPENRAPEAAFHLKALLFIEVCCALACSQSGSILVTDGLKSIPYPQFDLGARIDVHLI